MSTAIPDLWPPDFRVVSQPSPASILRQQGYLLGQRTQNLVVGEVESKTRGPGEFVHTLAISAPLLEYRQPIMHVEHKLEFYPADVAFYDEKGSHRARVSVADAKQFMDVLRQELAAPQLVKLIGSLVAQCEDAEPPE
jgi:hypothetical protein